MVKYLRTDDETHKYLCYFRDVLGHPNFRKVIKKMTVVVTIEDIRRALEYVKNHRNTEANIKRIKNIIQWADSELAKEIMPEYKEEVLKVKIFCEEYLK